MNGNRIANVSAPQNGGDAVNKTYVDKNTGGGSITSGSISSTISDTAYVPSSSWVTIYNPGSPKDLVYFHFMDQDDLSDYHTVYIDKIEITWKDGSSDVLPVDKTMTIENLKGVDSIAVHGDSGYENNAPVQYNIAVGN